MCLSALQFSALSSRRCESYQNCTATGRISHKTRRHARYDTEKPRRINPRVSRRNVGRLPSHLSTSQARLLASLSPCAIAPVLPPQLFQEWGQNAIVTDLYASCPTRSHVPARQGPPIQVRADIENAGTAKAHRSVRWPGSVLVVIASCLFLPIPPIICFADALSQHANFTTN